MAKRTIYIQGVPGLTYVYHPELHAGATIMLVLREGKKLVQTSGTPTGKQFKHNGAASRIEVDATIPINDMEEDYTGTGGARFPIFRPELFTIQLKN